MWADRLGVPPALWRHALQEVCTVVVQPAGVVVRRLVGFPVQVRSLLSTCGITVHLAKHGRARSYLQCHAAAAAAPKQTPNCSPSKHVHRTTAAATPASLHTQRCTTRHQLHHKQSGQQRQRSFCDPMTPASATPAGAAWPRAVLRTAPRRRRLLAPGRAPRHRPSPPGTSRPPLSPPTGSRPQPR